VGSEEVKAIAARGALCKQISDNQRKIRQSSSVKKIGRTMIRRSFRSGSVSACWTESIVRSWECARWKPEIRRGCGVVKGSHA
jgi:hypothetical protein